MSSPKKHYENLEMMLNYTPVSEHTPPKAAQKAGIEKMLSNQVETLSSILNNIQTDIEERKLLSTEILNNIVANYQYLKSKLYQLVFTSDSSEQSKSRSAIEQHLETLNEHHRTESHRNWKDISSLKAEFRNWFKEYRSLMERINLILEK